MSRKDTVDVAAERCWQRVGVLIYPDSVELVSSFLALILLIFVKESKRPRDNGWKIWPCFLVDRKGGTNFECATPSGIFKIRNIQCRFFPSSVSIGR